MSTQTLQHISPTEYLTRERQAEFKSEYINSEIIPMAGASRIHVLISTNLIFLLKLALRGLQYLCYQSDLRVMAQNAIMYPDLAVTRGEEEYFDLKGDTLLNPVLLIEVLSPSTADYDRGAKFEAYRTIPSLREYMLVAQDRPHIELFRLNDAGRWELFEVDGLDASLELASVPCTLTLSEVYERVVFERADQQRPDEA